MFREEFLPLHSRSNLAVKSYAVFFLFLMVEVLASLEGIQQDLQTHQMSIQDQAATQGEMAQALLTICTQLNMINK